MPLEEFNHDNKSWTHAKLCSAGVNVAKEF